MNQILIEFDNLCAKNRQLSENHGNVSSGNKDLTLYSYYFF